MTGLRLLAFNRINTMSSNPEIRRDFLRPVAIGQHSPLPRLSSSKASGTVRSSTRPMKRSSCSVLGTLCAVLALLPALPVAAQSNAKPPTQMTYQGFLTDGNGLPFGNTAPVNKTVTFRIYDALTGGTLKWSAQQIVTVDKGYFSVLLGQGSAVGSEPFNADLTGVFTGAGASDRYLELTADTTTLLPRLRFLPAPSAMLAKSATELLDPLTGAAALTVNGGNVTAVGTLTAGNLSGNGANVTSINASQITSGTLSASRLPGLDASQITGGTLSNARTTATAAGNANTIVARDAAGISYFANNSTGGAGIGATVMGSELKLNGNGYHHYSILNSLGDLQFGTTDWSGSLGSTLNPFFTLRGNANVGIGTVLPDSKLHVVESSGTVGANGMGSITLDHENDGGSSSIVFRSRINRGGADYGYLQYQDNQASANNGTENAVLTLGIQNDGDDHIALMASGNVGIGTQNPQYPLDVRRSVLRTFNLQAYLNQSGAFNDNSDRSDLSTTIWSEGNVQAASFWVRSDARIKAPIGPVSGETALAKVRQLRVTDYKYLDSVALGRQDKRGFIAQEVEKFLPEAVNRTTGVVPDIYTPAGGIEFEPATKLLTLALHKPHGLTTNDVVKLVLPDKESEFKVIGVPTPTNFVVKAEGKPGQVFVYGRRVKDFRSVDYDRIYTTGIAAVQELAQRVDQQSDALRRSAARVAELEKKTERLAAMEAEMAAMKKQLAGLVGVRPPESSTPQMAASPAQAGGR